MDKRKNLANFIESLGNYKVGFVQCDILHELEEILTRNIEQNFDSNMIKVAVEDRINPFRYMENAKTILVLAVPYYYDDDSLKKERYVFSRSSWGRDYHHVVKELLQKVSKYIKDTFNHNSVILSDNHDLDERFLAYKSGIGHYGKNASIINDEYGTYFYLGLLITDLPLEEESYTNQDELVDLCKDCNLCVNACPTDALTGDKRLDAKKCMSYLTQAKEEIDEPFIKKFQKYIYGCDICQIVCPHNKKIEKTDIHELFTPTGNEKVNPDELFNLSNRQFKSKYGDLSGSWRGKKVLLRNAILIAANNNHEAVIQLAREMDLEKEPEWFKHTVKQILNKRKEQ
ncbi:tRNA epoxyqueuosine(34) reductase QueG [Haloplasma contractile]|uniref:2-oxoglutarate ferredoxin oxidoreductase subunit delta protein n=1 Tax=Haloplasma contractile SSD-17B TaxID=1033810 RepID=U2EDD8_9MOLU|nr:tRNA epoxyqueuosine(34) reductase QueG [Haloplasma contractile]ERJ13003.1 2-oxoglutarate ferredoxin oxidoreductase subunit delta protein [Haloplasma contractile SSD-17B]